MSGITETEIKERLRVLEEEKARHLANYQAAFGHVEECRYWLAVLNQHQPAGGGEEVSPGEAFREDSHVPESTDKEVDDLDRGRGHEE